MSEEKTKTDELIQQIGELTTLYKEHMEADDTATLDEEKLKEMILEAQQELVLQRRGEEKAVQTELVGPPGFQALASETIKEGKFAGMKASDLQFVSALLRKGSLFFPSRVKLPSDALTKALTATGSGTGDELVPTAMAAELWEDFFLASKVVANIGVVPMPSDPFDMPLGLGDVTWRKGTQNTATTASDPATAKSTLTSTEQICEVNWSYDLDEDAVIAILPALRRRLGISGAEQMDAFVLNADATDAATGNINLDDADPDSDSYYLSGGQDGIRHQWIVDAASGSGLGTDAGGDALADSDVLSALVNMGKYAVSPDQCAMFCDVSTYIKGFMNLDAVQTLDKYGPEAVVLTGELAKYRGIPIVPSASHPLGESDGKVSDTSASNTLGSISVVNLNMWNVGFRRELLIEVDRDIQARSLIMVVSFRIAVAAHGTRASATHTAGIYNILVS